MPLSNYTALISFFRVTFHRSQRNVAASLGGVAILHSIAAMRSDRRVSAEVGIVKGRGLLTAITFPNACEVATRKETKIDRKGGSRMSTFRGAGVPASLPDSTSATSRRPLCLKSCVSPFLHRDCRSSLLCGVNISSGFLTYTPTSIALSK